jgi:hypothetical protein
LKRKEKFNERNFAPKFEADDNVNKKNIKIEDYCEEHSSWKNPLR